MDARKLIQRQIDEERASGPADAIRLTVREILKMVHTGMPGRVVSFDSAKQTAKVQPAIKRIWIGDDEDDDPVEAALPECPDVPVYFPGGGGYVLTFPVAPGDDCLLVFAERAIDFWWEKGGVQKPSEFRMHDLSDGFAFVGFRPKPNVVADFAVGACELRTLDGAAVVRIEGNAVVLGQKDPAPLGDAPLVKLDAVGSKTPLAKAWFAAVGTATGAGPFPSDGLTTKVTAK
jgi:hypothetical protein